MGGIAGNDPRDLWALLGGMAALATGLWVWTRRDDADPGRVVAECADGSVIGERGRFVRRRPGRSPGQRARAAAALAAGGARPAREDLRPGDLGALRIREGGAGESPWLVEGLDHEHLEVALRWPFGTAEEAMAALRLLQERVLDPAGRDRTAEAVDAEFDRVLGRDHLPGGAGA